ncbi:MAG: hypothetical protein ACRDI2_03685 [Chloroflexota bacterium]
MIRIPNLPAEAQSPAVDDLADRLVEALPEGDRAAARTLLIEQILPAELSGLADHPNPQRLAEVVYERLSEALQEADAPQRLAVLRAAAGRAALREQATGALALAIARYLLEHPEAAAAAQDWLDPMVEKWRSRSVGELAVEASQRLKRLDHWKERTQAEQPEVWNIGRTDYAYAKLTLQSARSGSFQTATGSLYDFLTSVGAPVDELDIH